MTIDSGDGKGAEGRWVVCLQFGRTNSTSYSPKLQIAFNNIIFDIFTTIRMPLTRHTLCFKSMPAGVNTAILIAEALIHRDVAGKHRHFRLGVLHEEHRADSVQIRAREIWDGLRRLVGGMWDELNHKCNGRSWDKRSIS